MMPQNSPPKKAQKLLGSSARAPPKAERLLGDDIPARSGTLNGNLERERRPSLSSKALALLGVTAEDVRIDSPASHGRGAALQRVARERRGAGRPRRSGRR